MIWMMHDLVVIILIKDLHNFMEYTFPLILFELQYVALQVNFFTDASGEFLYTVVEEYYAIGVFFIRNYFYLQYQAILLITV